ncbi:hypothetical protein IA539_12335 [Gordonia sp. zg691]|uniref:Uncharacterized protein n=1 Tax=Gordonia jinghuaiqii TaxID=2758710 RepID=A0A7D7LTM7_9ACTN|nr:hypothetical protein [Gordonia jinghuaiqii]MBD0861995.1 hypothetical protein [Gordonia jinghuaiqii]MCR5978780.1 hypothetical protein [Gordonia jinghuaiqii]QMT03085.1 hypothetical protein H1R19_08225 [Gordonia jinghuaiqii]
MHATVNTHHTPAAPPANPIADDFVPVPPTGPGARTRPGLRASLLAWASNAVAWVGFLAAMVLIVISFGRALSDQDASAYAYASLGVYLVAVLATAGAGAGLTVSFLARVRADDVNRVAPVVDLILLLLVTTFSAMTAVFPFVFVLAGR